MFLQEAIMDRDKHTHTRWRHAIKKDTQDNIYQSTEATQNCTSHVFMLCERGPIPLLPKRAPILCDLGPLPLRARTPTVDRLMTTAQLFKNTCRPTHNNVVALWHPWSTCWCLGQSTEGKTATCKKMLCNQHIINTLLYRHGVLQDSWEPGRKFPCLRRQGSLKPRLHKRSARHTKCKSQPKQAQTDSELAITSEIGKKTSLS